jgi:hypothetical protein
MRKSKLLTGLLLLCLSCYPPKHPPKHSPKQEQPNGIWIPAEISWDVESDPTAEIRMIIAGFKTIYIYDDTSFVLFSSAQTKAENDSITFMAEPGFSVSAGTIDTVSHDLSFKVSYRKLYEVFKHVGEIYPGAGREDTIKVIESGDTLSALIFEGKKYVRGDNRFTWTSKMVLEGMVHNFVPVLILSPGVY